MLRAMTRAESGPWVLAGVTAAAYGLLPLAVDAWVLESEYLVQLAGLAALGAAGILIGSRLPLLDRVHHLPRVRVDQEHFQMAIWGSFLGFVLLANATAARVPLVAALQGVDADTLALLREQFLKAREGWQASFPYVNAVLAGALVPYALVILMLRRHRLRWVLFGVFLFYCVSFVEKAFFLRAVIPFAYVVIQRRIALAIRPEVVLAGALGVLGLVTVVSGAGSREQAGQSEDFFSTSFAPSGALGFLAWRAVAIPVVTAADTLRIFEEEYGGRPLLGASSTLLAGVLGLQRVDVEREVFAVQFGQTETETGNANSVFLTEAFLNFGYAGVVAFSLLVGLVLRIFGRSKDEALRSLWILFCFGVFVGPVTGTLFSNGFLAVLALSLLVRLEPLAKGREELIPEVPAEARR